jgi:hypothetical protein
MKLIDFQKLRAWYTSNFEAKIKGRRILFEDIEPLIKDLSDKFQVEIAGRSENNIPIYKISLGTGKKNILAWSQMHGNESTGTKALFDLFRFFENPTSEFQPIVTEILRECRIECICMLNPDGAINFTRENKDGIDLNRDAVALKAKESRLLRKHLDAFNPKFCFNLHDQRSIFNVKGTANPATISFLAPSIDPERTITEGRKETMSVIVAMNDFIQKGLPNQVGRYTDEFYPTATGDNFQKLGHNTILIEAGHYRDDLEREVSREFNFYALVKGLYFIATSDTYKNYNPYFDIPNNDNKFFDRIYKNIKVTDKNGSKTLDIGVQIKFKVVDNKLVQYQCIENSGDLSAYHSYHIIDSENLDYNELKLSDS